MNEENKQPAADQISEREELKYIGSIRLLPGQRLWEMDVEKGIIRLAEYELIEKIGDAGNVVVERKLKIKKGHLYAPAINARNADRKFIQRLTGMSYRQYLGMFGLSTKK